MITRRTRRLSDTTLSRQFSTSWRSLHQTPRCSICHIQPRSLEKVSKGVNWRSTQRLTSFTFVLALKPIPTMLFGFLVGGKSYPIHKFVFVLLIVCGAIMFLLKSDQPTYESSYLGYSLVGISLLMNGCSAGVQEKMRAVSRPSPLNLMLFMNSWSSLFVVVGIIASGEIEGFVRFCTKHSDVLVHISLLLIVGAFGQFFSCSMITNFGVLPTSIVLTIRKFFNVLFSVIYFNNVLSLMQWLATALIFTSLLADSLLSFVIFRTDKNNDVKNCEESESQANNEKKFETVMQEKSKSLPV